MDTNGRPCPHVPGFNCPMMPGLECPEMNLAVPTDPAEAKARFCRSEARRAGLKTDGPEDVPVDYRK